MIIPYTFVFRLNWPKIMPHCSYSIQKFYKSKWNGVVGLEVHAQIDSVTKLFSGASTTFGSPPNTNVSFYDAAIPGTLPILNKSCVDHAVRTALMLNANINMVSLFDRKHYFYSDLPAGYQVTQQRMPLATGGQLQLPSDREKRKKSVRIRQIQLEHDSGKSFHDSVENKSLIDLNRAGVGLMEIVFEPDLSNGKEAASLVKELTLILSRLGSCSCRMEEGALRVDANVSVNKVESTDLGTRTEVKNIGSIRGVAKAIDWEIERQISILENGGIVENETRSWDAEAEITLSMRDKEIMQDYRFMPEPNLLPLYLNPTEVENMKNSLPELPSQTRSKLIQDYKLSQEMAFRLVNESELLKLFFIILEKDKIIKGKTVASFLLNELLTLVNKDKFDLRKINSNYIADLLRMLDSGDINLVTARMILDEIKEGDKDPVQVVEERGLKQLKDSQSLSALCDRVIAENPAAVKQYKSGKAKVFKALLGEAAKISGGTADMKQLSVMLKERLSH